MSELLTRVSSLLEAPYSRLMEERNKGRKVVGVTPMHFPEELVHALGALPVLLQAGVEPVTVGLGHIYPFFCGFTRSNVDLASKGKLDSLFDAVVVSDICLQIRHMAHIMRRMMPRTPFVYMQWPLQVDGERFVEFARLRLDRCRRELQELLGTDISDTALRKSIALYNRHRALLRRIYETRKMKQGALTAKEALVLAMSGMVLPKEEHIEIMERFIAEMDTRRPPARKGPRLFASGHLCHAPKVDFIHLIEDLGGAVVGDDLFTGSRYFATDVKETGDPMEALVRRYLNLAIPCPTRVDSRQEWGEYLVRASRECGANGVVVFMVKFCEPQMIYYPYINDVLTKAGIPHIMIETEYEVVSLEGTRTRIQAFLEMLGK